MRLSNTIPPSALSDYDAERINDLAMSFEICFMHMKRTPKCTGDRLTSIATALPDTCLYFQAKYYNQKFHAGLNVRFFYQGQNPQKKKDKYSTDRTGLIDAMTIS